MGKGDLVRFTQNDLTFYGTIISVVNDVYAVSHHSYRTGQTTVTQFTIDKLIKIGNA